MCAALTARILNDITYICCNTLRYPHVPTAPTTRSLADRVPVGRPTHYASLYVLRFIIFRVCRARTHVAPKTQSAAAGRSSTKWGHGVAGRNGVAKGRRSAREPDHWVTRWTGMTPQRPRPVSRLNGARATLSGGGDYRSLPM